MKNKINELRIECVEKELNEINRQLCLYYLLLEIN